MVEATSIIFQALAVVFALFALSRVVLRLKDGKITWPEFSFWTVIWAAVIVVAINPDLTFTLSNALGIERGVDVAVYCSIIILFYMMFRMLVKMEMLEQEITKAVRKDAISKGGKKKKK